VLAVDDEIHCLMSMRIMLEGNGYKVIEAQGGLKALEYLNTAEERIDVILLDLMMPDMYGTDVLLAVKQNERFKNIPIIIQSGVANDMEISKAMQSGASAHIRKPYNRTILLEAIGKATQSN
jgi:CheY-like chemotaxis protein